MSALSVSKTVLAALLTLMILLLGATDGRTASAPTPTVSIRAISGYAGHAFVYAQVSQGGNIYPAPTGTMHGSPFYAEWLPLPVSTPGCSSVWGVYVVDKTTNTQINPPTDRSNRNFGTADRVCATPTTTPVDVPPLGDAAARLDLDLTVSMSPAVASVGSPSVVAARLDSAVSEDLNAYMNMAIEDWQVTSWFVDFGDGQSSTVAGGNTSLMASHTYQAIGQYDARVIASITGHAQATVYGPYGWPQLIQQGFAVDIGNDLLASARLRSIRRYLPPVAVVSITPSLYPAFPDPALGGFREINVVRGRLMLMLVHVDVLREALLTVNGRVTGYARSRLIAWRLDSEPSDGANGSGTQAGPLHQPRDLLQLQWDLPDQLQGQQSQAYTVPLTLVVQSRYPDGHLATFSIASSFSVSVNFAAESG